MPTLAGLPIEIIDAVVGHLEQGERVRHATIIATDLVLQAPESRSAVCVQARLALTCKALLPLILSYPVSIHGTTWRQPDQDPSCPTLEASMQAFNSCLRRRANRIAELRITADATPWWLRQRVRIPRPLPIVHGQTPAYKCGPPPT